MKTRKGDREGDQWRLLAGDCRRRLKDIPSKSATLCVTSPPYWMIWDYGSVAQVGGELDLTEYVRTLVAIFNEIRRILLNTGVLWLNLGDTYNAYNGGRGSSRGSERRRQGCAREFPKGYGLTEKSLNDRCLTGVPWRVANALADAGWTLRADVIWRKPNAKPHRVTDRPQTVHEYLFLLSNGRWYRYDRDLGPKSTVVDVNTEQTKGRAGGPPRFPAALIEPLILASSKFGDTVLDPFAGAGTVLTSAVALGRRAIGIELMADSREEIERNLGATQQRLPITAQNPAQTPTLWGGKEGEHESRR